MGREEVDSSMHLLYQLKGLHVLLVDYDPVSLSKSTILLREASFKVTHTKIQQVALTLLQECKGQFKAVVTSDQKQDMDCLSFIQRIRTIQQAIPIVVVSSSESTADPGMKPLFDTTCYVINKPVTKNALERVLQWHMMRLSVQVRTNDLKGKEKAVTGNGANDVSPVNPKGLRGDLVGRQTTRKGDQREDNRGLQLEKTRKPKRSKPYEGEASAKLKGKCTIDPSKAKPSYEKKVRPTFDPEQHKKLMAAISYHGPTKHIGMSHFFPRRGPYFRFPLRSQGHQQQQLPAATAIAERCDREKKMKEAFSSTPRAPWTQQLYQKYKQALSTNKAQGMKGYRYDQPFQMTCRSQPPSWMSPQAWKNRMNSELLGNSNTSHVAMGPFPMSAPRSKNGPINPNMESVNRFNDSVVNGMAQNMNTGTLTNPVILDEGNTSNAVALNQDTHSLGVPSNDILNGFFDGVQDEMSFGNNKATSSYSLQTEPGHLDYSGLLEAEKGNNMMSTQITGFNDSNSYGQSATSNEIAFPYSSEGMNAPGFHTVNPPEFTPTVNNTFSALQNTYDLPTGNDAALQMTELNSGIGESYEQVVPGTGFGSSGFSPLYSPLNVDMPDLVVMGQQQLSSSGANAPFGLQNASDFPITPSGLLAAMDDDDSLYAVVGSGFQSPNDVFPGWNDVPPQTNQAQMGAYTATTTEVEQYVNHEHFEEQNVVPGQASFQGSEVNIWPDHVPAWIDTFPQTNQTQMGAYTAADTEVGEYVNHEPVMEQNVVLQKNQVGTSANGSTKQASEGEERAKYLNSEGDVDEFADLFTFLDTHEDGTNSVADEAKEVNADKGIAEVEEDNSYFDIDSFDFY